MAWFKVDDRFWSHPVTSELSDSATALWIRAGSWSACHLTDGEIPKSKLKAFGSRMRAAQELVDAGLWSYSATSQTFSIQNWARYQPEKAQVLKKREDTKNRVNAYRNKDSNAVTERVSNTSPDPTRTQPIKEHMYSEAERKQPYSKDFETWWASYPRRQQKGDAWKAWETLRKKRELPELALLTDASKKYGERVTDQQFQKLPAGWLRAACWEDEPLNSKPLPYVEREGYDPGVAYHPPAPAGKRYAVDAIDYV
jgi:hypothetical protein